MSMNSTQTNVRLLGISGPCFSNSSTIAGDTCCPNALTMRWRSSSARNTLVTRPLDLIGHEAGGESGQHEHHPLRQVERRQREQGAGCHLAPADEGERQDYILHRRHASSEHRKPEIEPQRGEDYEDRIHMGGGALQRIHRVHLARTEQNEAAWDAGLDKRVQESQPPWQGLALLEPAADDLTDYQLVAGQQYEDGNDLQGPRGSEDPRPKGVHREGDHQPARQPGENQHAGALAPEDLAGQPFLEAKNA